MNKKIKRVLAFLLVVTLTVGQFPIKVIADNIEISEETDNKEVTTEDLFEFDEEKGEITNYLGEDKDVVIPSEISGTRVIGIGDGAFNNKGLTSIVIPEGVEYTGFGSLGKNNFERVSLPSTMKTLGKYTFSLCKNLKEVKLNEGLVNIEEFALANLESLTGEIIIPSSVEWIGPNAFRKSNLISMRILGDENSPHIVLKNNLSDHLQYIILEDENKYIDIDYTAFSNREKKDKTTVTSIDKIIELDLSQPDDIKKWIEDNLAINFFLSYIKLDDTSGRSDEHVKLNINWQEINNFTPGDTIKVIGVMDPVKQGDFIKKEGYGLLDPSSSLETNTIELTIKTKENNQNDDLYNFDEEKGVITGYLGSETDIEIPNKINGIDVKGIGKGAFSKKNLTSLVLPEGLEFTEYGAFSNNKLTSIEFPSSMKSIGSYTFSANKNLSKLTFNDGLEEINDHAFFGDSALKSSLVIPESLKWIGPSAFRNTRVDELHIKGDKNSSKLILKNNLGQEIKNLELEDISKRLYIDFTAFCNNEKQNYISLTNPVKLELDNQEDLMNWIEENINIQFMSSYQNNNTDFKKLSELKTGKYDEYVDIGIVWDPIENFSIGKLELTGKMEEINDNSFPEKEGYIMNKASNYGGTNNISFLFDIVEKSEKTDNSKFILEDFTFDKNKITGFSEKGLAKLEILKDLEIPNKNSDGSPIKEIGKDAFKNKGLLSIKIPDTVKK